MIVGCWSDDSDKTIIVVASDDRLATITLDHEGLAVQHLVNPDDMEDVSEGGVTTGGDLVADLDFVDVLGVGVVVHTHI